MGGRLCLLGFSANTLALVFNTLKALGRIGDLVIVENLRTDDATPYDCGLPHQRLWYEDYSGREDDAYFLGVTGAAVKAAVFDFFAARLPAPRERFLNLLHPSVQLAYEHRLSTGIFAEPGCIIAPFAEVGFGVSLLRGASIGHHAHLDDFVTVAPGARLAGHARVGSGTTIGVGAIVFDHVSIGAHCIIGGGSVVNKDIPDDVVAYGSPCRVVRPRTVQP